MWEERFEGKYQEFDFVSVKGMKPIRHPKRGQVNSWVCESGVHERLLIYVFGSHQHTDSI